MSSSKLDPKTLELALQHAPILKFDRNEPFFPSCVGVTLFLKPSRSPSFPRTVVIPAEAEYVLEYAVWWDWDIQHLYELEHIWVGVGKSGQVITVEGSWHGTYRSFKNWQEEDGHPIIYSQPGKHAFASDPKDFPRLRTWLACTAWAGNMGLLVKDMFAEPLRPLKSRRTDQLIRGYLRHFAFEPSFRFDKEVRFSQQMIVSWDEMRIYIPQRIKAVIAELLKSEESRKNVKL